MNNEVFAGCYLKLTRFFTRKPEENKRNSNSMAILFCKS